MNFKTHKKGLIALALIFFMIMPMLAASNLVHASAAGAISVVETGTGGTTNVNSITVPASDPIGTTVTVDLYISSAVTVQSWSIGTITWNPAVLNLQTQTQGPWLADNTASESTDFLPGVISNTAGSDEGGISCAIVAITPSVAATPAGVLATLTFKTTGFGTSPIHIGSATLYASPTDTTGTAATTADASVTVQTPPLSISLVPSGMTSGNTVTLPPTPSPIGTTFAMDAYITGAVGNVWGWSLDMTWNPAVLSLQTVVEGNYLTQTSATDYNLGVPNNAEGILQGGVSDAFTTSIEEPAGAGVLATFTFKVVGYGSGLASSPSVIQITPGLSTGALFTDSIPPTAITPVTLNNGNYVWVAPTPTNPQAIAIVDNSPFGTGSDNTFTGYGITLDGSTSTPGINTEPPPTQACPIQTYSWSILLVGASSPITVSGNAATAATVALTSAQIGEVAGTITATLMVTAPSPTGTPAPGYTGTSTTTLTIQVETPYPGGVLDIWTQNGGQGPNVDASSFGPQQLVDIYAYVSYNGAPVVDKTVTFDVYLDGVYQSFTTAQTDQSGIAIGQYRLPWQDSDPTQYFGEMTISSSVDVAQVVLTDSCSFYYGYQLQVDSVVITNGATGSAPTFNRYGDGMNTVDATVTVTNTMWNSQVFWLTGTIYDNNNVPVASFIAQETIGAGVPISGNTNTWQNTNTQTYQITLTIPTWAYVGTATLYVNIFNGNPEQNGVAWSPQVQAPLVITASYPNIVIVNPPTQVMNVQYQVENDEDTGLQGYWALDTYEKTVQVWSLGSDQYEVVATYSGTFTTFHGALSPMTGTVEPATETGTLHGEYIATFTATSFNPNNLVAYGTISNGNLGGSQTDILKGTYALQTGNPYTYDVFSLYFPGYTNFNYVSWGWIYTISSGTSLVWNNNSAGNTGDIVT